MPAEPGSALHNALWAKLEGEQGAYPLALHLADSAAMARALWDLWLRPELRARLESELGGRARDLAALCAGLHDLGKANPGFAGRFWAVGNTGGGDSMREVLEGAGFDLGVGMHPGFARKLDAEHFARRHEQVSAWAIAEDRGGDPVWPDDLASDRWLELVALGHHGWFYNSTEDDKSGRIKRAYSGAWKEARIDLRNAVEHALDLTTADVQSTRVSPASIILLTGLTILADRLASQETHLLDQQARMSAGELDPTDLAGWIERSASRCEDAVRTHLGVPQPWGDPLTEILHGRPLRPVQEDALATGAGLWSVMTPTGGGKTEAALLRHSRQPERLIFLLPTQATANSLMRRVVRIYGNGDAVGALAHSGALTESFNDPRIEDDAEDAPRGLYPTDFVARRSDRLLASVCVATVDQALMADLHLKWTPLRMLALANAHVVIDEAHTLDPYQAVLTEQILWWLGEVGARVTLLSATMPTAQRNAFVNAYAHTPDDEGRGEAEFPSTAHVGAPGADAPSELEVRPSPVAPYAIGVELEATEDPIAAHLDWVRKQRAAAPRARLGVVVNIIDRAIEIADELRRRGERVLVLHSRMTLEHRRRVAAALESELGPGGVGEGLVVVGTQAIEASLDIDLDALSTDLAPAPSLIQRAGRAWRRADPERSDRLPGAERLQLHIVRGEERGEQGTTAELVRARRRFALPYQPAVLRRAWQYLSSRSEIQVPQDVQGFVETATPVLAETMWDEEPELELGSELGAASAAQAEEDEILEEFGDLALRMSQAKSMSIPWSEVLDPRIELGRFAELRRQRLPGLDEEKGTRLIERETVRCLLLDDPDGAPGAWLGPSGGLAVERFDREQLRQLQGATVSLSGKLGRSVLKSCAPVDGGPPVLRGTYVVDLRATGCPIAYDPLLGIRSRQKGASR